MDVSPFAGLPGLPGLFSAGFDASSSTARSNALRPIQDLEQADELALLGPASVLSGSLQAALLDSQTLASQPPATPGTADPALEAALNEASLLQTGMLDSTLLGSMSQGGMSQAYTGMTEPGAFGGGLLQAGLLESLASLQADTGSNTGAAAPPKLPPAGSGPLGTQVNTYA